MNELDELRRQGADYKYRRALKRKARVAKIRHLLRACAIWRKRS